MIAITGATGQLGRLVIDCVLTKVPAEKVVAIVRSPAKAQDLAAKGVIVRQGDYNNPATLEKALAGVERLLLISSSEVGQRAPQHQAVIDAAKRNGVKFVAYTSLLHADRSPLGLAEEHRQTEAALAASGLAYALLRNGWYTENYAASIPSALKFNAFTGAAADGRIASAARQDYAAAAAAVITQAEPVNKIYELAGDSSYTLAEFAAEIARQSGKPIAWHPLAQQDFAALLIEAGLPQGLAEMLADSDAGAAQGGLYDESGTLSQLIGRATTPWQETIAAALKASQA
ncbi:SDR family oxidoreductase [Mixta sp. Marseille-Q2659]|uniref:SDR family oxidoreductase n=1 Tax=Mixta sp. Marseille-Q2659 TaxID=2736607 RepID=UPI0023B8CEFF|nr:SDR family oxidoreductase [Mixta sp. Marseille-Q2659]